MEEKKKERKQVEIDSLLPIKTSLSSFFRYWLEFLKPTHHLTSSQMDVMAAFLRYRYELSKNISDPEILDKFIMGEEIRKKIREECDMSTTHFQVAMSTLRKNGAIKDGKIHPKLIPNVIEESGSFRLLIYFNFKEDVQ